jgi:hypothetical protein
MKLSEIGVENQQSFVTRLSGTVARKTLLSVLGTVSSMLTTAQNWGYICEGLKFGMLVLPERSVHEEARLSPKNKHAASSRKRKGSTA